MADALRNDFLFDEEFEQQNFPLNIILNEDCIEGMKNLPDNSFDIAIVDPPYNLSSGGSWKWNNSEKNLGFGGAWSKVMENWDNMPLMEYFNFCAAWLSQIKRVVKPTGSFWIHGTYHNIGIINFLMQLESLEIINEVIWYKRNSFPNLSGRRLTASHETILWGHTGTSKKREYNFNYEKSKAYFSPEDKLKEAGKQMRTVWDIPNNKAKEELAYGKHPTQKPLRLAKRMLEISAPENAKVLVPFAGSGTECVAAKEMGFDFLGFETDAEYISLARTRLEHCKKEVNLFTVK